MALFCPTVPIVAAIFIDVLARFKRPNYQGKRRRSTEGVEGTNKGHENGEAHGPCWRPLDRTVRLVADAGVVELRMELHLAIGI